MDRETEQGLSLLITKVSALEYLVRTLFYTEFSKHPDPVASARAFAEDLRRRMESVPVAAHQAAFTLRLQETLNEFFDSLLGELQKAKRGGAG